MRPLLKDSVKFFGQHRELKNKSRRKKIFLMKLEHSKKYSVKTL
jgi:hypothetical protein